MKDSALPWWPLGRKAAARLKETIRQSGLFDEPWYRNRYAPSARDPIAHYLWRGARRGYNPSVLFDGAWYAVTHGLRKENPLVHFILEGAGRGLDPHPLFDISYYRGNAGNDAAACEGNPLAHFLARGGLEGRSPHPLFDAAWYLQNNPDVARAGVNPLVHYLQHGAAEGRDPGPEFSTDWYLARHLDVAARGLNPLYHYVAYGKAEGRSARGSREDIDLVLLSGLFDREYYLERNPDVAETGVNALQHYIDFGGVEGRRPSAWFDGQRYLRNNPDVAAERVNPLLHWLRYGRIQGRQSPIRPDFDLRLVELCDPKTIETEFERSSDRDFKVSIITPTFNTPVEFLEELFFTLLNQRYTNWEWVIVDDGSTNLDTVNTLRSIAQRSDRVSLTFAHHLGISGASNRALEMSTGTHVALVDHDDLLSRDALLHVWRAWLADRECAGFYTDECKLSDAGELFDFSHKPAWSPVYLENTMYIGHLTVYRRDVVEAVGGFRSKYDGTQDFDLALRVSRRVERLIHIPEICYLWRAVAGSTAATLSAKEYALERQRLALLDHAVAKNPEASVEPGWSLGFWRVNYPMRGASPLVSYVIPTAARTRMVRGEETDLLTHCIESLEKSRFYDNVEYVVVHNGDLTEAHLAFLAKVPRVKLVEFKSTGFLNISRKFNLGVDNASGEFVCLMNDDIEIVTEEGGRRLVGFMHSNPGVGAVATLCLYEDGQVQHNGMILLSGGPTHAGIYKPPGFPGHFGNLQCRREAFGVSGALMFVRRSLWRELGGWSEQFPLNYNDVDFSLRVREAGYSCVVDPGVVAYHFESASKVGTFAVEKSSLLMRWPNLVDPFFNRSFKQGSPYYELATAGEEEERIDRDPQRFETWLNRRVAERSTRLVAKGIHKLTVGVSIYNEAPRLLEEMAMSIAMQTYRNVEVIFVDNGTTRPETVAWIDRIAASGFARVIRHPVNKGISGANRAIAAAMTGSFLLMADADDFLTVDALMVMAHAIEQNPDGRIFYSDEVNSDPNSRLFHPFFKPDFDPVLITNCCFPTHLMAISRDLLRAIEAYSDDRATWCHDYDSVTRAMARGVRPIHVPEFLYAWRIIPGSTAAAGHEAKPQTIGSQKFVLDRLVADLGLAGTIAIEANPLFDHEGMWHARLVGAPPAVTSLQMTAAWSDPARRVALSALEEAVAREDGAEWLAILAEGADREAVVRNLFAVALLSPRLAAVSGIVLEQETTRVRWGGACFYPGGLLVDPYGGADFAETSGYHGQLYCQRCVDVVAPVNVLIRKDALRRVLSSDRTFTFPNLMVALGRDAAENDGLVAVTPHVTCQVGKDWIAPVRLADPDGQWRPASSRWYGPELPYLTGEAYGIVDQPGAGPG